MERPTFTHADAGREARIVECLARHHKKAATVLALLEKHSGDEPGKWLRYSLVELAGEMRLEAAVPLLMRHVGNASDPGMAEWAAAALQRIGGNVVVREIDARWWDSGPEFRRAAAAVLDRIRGELCVERALAFFLAEEDPETLLVLAEALLSNFATEDVEWIWKYVAELADAEREPDARDLRYHLVAVYTVMGTTFPWFDAWREAAVRDDWGMFRLKYHRGPDFIAPE